MQKEYKSKEDTFTVKSSQVEGLRRQTRRKLIKAGLMSIPLIMTVYSRPLFANTNGSIGALQYGGYNDDSRPEEFLDEEYFENPYRQELDLSDQEEGFYFKHSRNARSRF